MSALNRHRLGWLLWLAGLLVSLGLAPASAAAPGLGLVACLAYPSSQDDSKYALPELLEDAIQVCSLLERAGYSPALARAPRHGVAKAAKAWLAESPHGAGEALQLLFYAGHGKWTGKTTEFLFTAKAQGAEWFDQKELAAQLDPAAPWRALVLNSCDSGYFDSSIMKAPATVIGSGYGEVSARGLGRNTLFGSALTQALRGAADSDCDGMLTDAEVANYINGELERRARRDALYWTNLPLATVRRQAAHEVPIGFVSRRRNCDSVALAALRRIVPRATWERLVLQSAIASRQPGKQLPMTRLTSLAIHDPDNLAPQLSRLLAVAAPTLSFEIFTVPSKQLAVVEEAARRAAFVAILVLDVQARAEGQLFIELRRERDGAILWANYYRDAEPELAQRTAWQLVRRANPKYVFHNAVTDDEILVQVHGSVATADATWNVERIGRNTLFTTKPERESIALGVRQAAPCQGGQGQCFYINKEPSLLSGEWLVVDSH